MKKISKLLFSLSFSLMIFSCNEEMIEKPIQENFSSIDMLKTDTVFIGLIEANMKLINDVVDLDKAKSLIEMQVLTENELNELSISLGFKNTSTYQNFINNQNAILRDLNEEYNLESYDKDVIINLGVEAIYLKNQNATARIFLEDCNCERIRINCIVQVGTAAVLAHLACGSVDWTGVGIPICHGAVIIGQIAATDNCMAEAENCVADCIIVN